MSIPKFTKNSQPNNRYAGIFLLLFVNYFVLKAIGELDKVQELRLVEMEPKLQEVYSCAESWEEIIITQLDFPTDIYVFIQKAWVKNQAMAKQSNITLAPKIFAEQFADMFVESNVTNP